MKRLRSQWRNQMSCTAAWLLLYSPNTQSAGRRVCVSVNNRCCFLQTQGLVLRLPNEKAALSTIRRRNRPVLSLTHHEHPTSGLILTFTQKWKYCQVFPNPSFLPWNTKDDALNNVKVISPPYAITMNEALKLKKNKAAYHITHTSLCAICETFGSHNKNFSSLKILISTLWFCLAC